MARIDLRTLAHSYRPNPAGRADYALKPMDMTWRDGGAYALLGPSGCGKTTLLNIISGLLVPSQGQVLFDDEDVTAVIPEDRNIAQVFQFPVIYDTMTVRQNLEFPLRNRRVPEPEIAARVAEIAEALHMTEDLPRKARGLTADAKQKISLGRGLVRQDTAAILFDEPLTVIDPHLKWQLRSQLKALHRRYDFTMIYVTHDQTEALTFADSVVVMHDGEVVQVGTPEELFERPAHTFVGYFIGSPGMNVLPCTVDGRTARVGASEIALARAYAPRNGKVELGVRPEFVRVAPAGAGAESGGVPVRVTGVEDVGRYRIARLRLEGHPMAAILPDDARIDGDTAAVSFDPAHVNVYVDDHRVEGEA
ncbi:ABC transporter ATP-binding protein [Roseospira goensis]|uniref:Glycerol transport system ATP-binding protein n=1 Tax=Roseospira goensis TaxID=391922 RepID=A0A7W6WJG6_9PROT|nr:ABC transporter ATP-binding protein [Roseospira goensis]MBB4284548.1 glycerol transport system ATP-binding protein [Roseospira goensis]